MPRWMRTSSRKSAQLVVTLAGTRDLIFSGQQLDHDGADLVDLGHDVYQVRSQGAGHARVAGRFRILNDDGTAGTFHDFGAFGPIGTRTRQDDGDEPLPEGRCRCCQQQVNRRFRSIDAVLR
jgi:hypothetical protein